MECPRVQGQGPPISRELLGMVAVEVRAREYVGADTAR